MDTDDIVYFYHHHDDNTDSGVYNSAIGIYNYFKNRFVVTELGGNRL